MDREQVIKYEIGHCVMLYILSNEHTAQQIFKLKNRTLSSVDDDFESRALDYTLLPEFFPTSTSKMTLIMGGPLAVQGIEYSGKIIEQAIRSQRRPQGREIAAARSSLYYEFRKLWTSLHRGFFNAVRPSTEDGWDADVRMFLGIDRRQIRFFRSVEALRKIWELDALDHNMVADTLQRVRDEYEHEFIYTQTQDQSQNTDKVRISYEFTTAYLIQQEAKATNFQEVIGVGLNSICNNWFMQLTDTQKIASIISHWFFDPIHPSFVGNEDYFFNEVHRISMYGHNHLESEAVHRLANIISQNPEARNSILEACQWLELNRNIIRRRANILAFKMPNSPYWISRERIESIWRGEEDDRFPICHINFTHLL